MDLFKERKFCKYWNIPSAYMYMYKLVHAYLCIYKHTHKHTYKSVAITHTAGTVFKEEKTALKMLILGHFFFLKSTLFVSLPLLTTVFNKDFKQSWYLMSAREWGNMYSHTLLVEMKLVKTLGSTTEQ